MKKKLLAILMVVVMGVFMFPAVVGATNPTVTITVSATVVAITNSQANWAIGAVEPGDIRWWNTTNTENDTYSQINNTGNVAVDILIEGTDLEGGAYDWVLAAAAGNQTYSLMANSEATPTVYNVEVKSSGYNNLTTNLTVADKYDWSMKFSVPTAFNATDTGASKSATITLVASKH